MFIGISPICTADITRGEILRKIWYLEIVLYGTNFHVQKAIATTLFITLKAFEHHEMCSKPDTLEWSVRVSILNP